MQLLVEFEVQLVTHASMLFVEGIADLDKDCQGGRL